MKRYCQTLTLVDNPEMIEKYVEAHKHVWPEIIGGQRMVGISRYANLSLWSLIIYDHGYR